MKHHLTDQLLMAYSAAQLPEAFSLVVATHISMCDECRARLGSFDAVGGALLGDCGPVEMSPGSFQATLNLLSRLPQDRPHRQTTGGLPQPLLEYVGASLSDVKWRPIGMGVRQAVLPTSKDASVRLLYIPAGAAVPDHGHRGMELTLVLEGAFRDQTDRFGPGDIEIADEAMQHTPIAEDAGPCICLSATDAPLRFKRLLPRLAQSILRI